MIRLCLQNIGLHGFLMFSLPLCIFKGAGVPWDQIMKNDFEYLSDRGDHGGH